MILLMEKIRLTTCYKWKSYKKFGYSHYQTADSQISAINSITLRIQECSGCPLFFEAEKTSIWLDSEIVLEMIPTCGRFCKLDVLGLVAGCFSFLSTLSELVGADLTLQPFEMICYGGFRWPGSPSNIDLMSPKTESVKSQKFRELYYFGVV